MSEFAGMNVLVIGLARAGTGMARALKSAGANVCVVDQKSADSPNLFAPMDEMNSVGVEVITSWPGTLDGLKPDILAPSPGVPKKHPALLQATKLGLPVLSEIEIAYRLTRSPIVAITGTNGKSTVTGLTYHLLSSAGKNAILCGNIAGSGYPELTINDAVVKASGEILVAEVSSFQLEWVERFRPKAATITNITQDHLDRYDSFEEYRDTKRRIYARMGHGDLIVANSERPETLPADTDAEVVLIGEQARIENETIRFQDAVVEMSSLWVPARHSLVNLGHAVLLCRAFGLTPPDVLPHVHSFRGLENRLELVGEKNGVRVVNNSMCTNPSALVSSLEGVQGEIVLIAGGVSKVSDLRPLVDVGKRVPRAILFGRDAKNIAAPITEGGATTAIYETLEQAFDAAVKEAKPGQTILLSPGCASFDQFEDFIDRGNRFKRMARVWIES